MVILRPRLTIVVPFLLTVIITALLTALAFDAGRFRTQVWEKAPDDRIVATVGGRPITLQQVQTAASLPLYVLETQRHQLLQQALQQRIDEELLESEASRQGVTVQQLIDQASQSESIARIANLPGPMKRANAAGQPPTFDGQEQARIRQALLVSLRRKADTHINFPAVEPPTLPVSTDDDPRLGPENAPVTIVEFSDFQCPFCQMSVGVLREVRQMYGDKVQVVYRDFPGQNHRDAVPAAQASECAHEQGKFWEYHDLLFANQKALTRPSLMDYAKQVNLNVPQLEKALDEKSLEAQVDADVKLGEEVNVSGTPTVFINGKRVPNPTEFEPVAKLIDAALGA